MNKQYNLKLDLQFRCNNSIMKFDEFDNNTSDFFIKINNGGKAFDIEKAIVVLAVIKPSGKVSSQFVEVENGFVYADLKPNMKDEIGTYTARAMLILENEKVVTDTISYEVEEDKVFSLLNDTVTTTEDFSLLTDMLNRLSTIEISEEQRMINEAERILAEENRKIEEAKRVEAELIRQHEEADRSKYDAIRESNENIRKQNESIRLANETNRIDEESKRVEEENKRKLAEEERKANYNFMTEDEERRRSEANAHKEAENLRVQAETNRVNEEAKRRTIEQARVSAENTRVNNENTREANETTRQTNETHRVEAETQRQNRYNSFILDAEANANNFENYTNTAKVKEEERKSNELDRRTQEAKRVSNEVERISNENTRKANEETRESNEASRQDVFENKVNEVDEKIIEINTTKDNFVSSINTKVDNKISELDGAKSDMTTTVSNKVNEVETRFNALTSKQQQDAEVIDARDGETSLKARLDRDIEKAKQVYVNVEGNHISTDSSNGYAKNVEILGNTVQDASNLADIRSVGDKIEGQELYEIPIVSVGKNLFCHPNTTLPSEISYDKETQIYTLNGTWNGHKKVYIGDMLEAKKGDSISVTVEVLGGSTTNNNGFIVGGYNEKDGKTSWVGSSPQINTNDIKVYTSTQILDRDGCDFITFWVNLSATFNNFKIRVMFEKNTQPTPYEPYIEDKLTILSPVQLEKVGDVADKIICKDGVWGVEKNIIDYVPKINHASDIRTYNNVESSLYRGFFVYFDDVNITNFANKPNVISNYFSPCGDKDSITSGLINGCIGGFDHTASRYYIAFSILKSELSENTNIGAFEWFKNKEDLFFKIQLATPQFIPLPHSQQLKLRTFANKTSISFGCEIEGTIKAQIPKSLGATVNTHTEQISNLNKELDRVKKLEESTVSTVETESDFTTVEATSNGYFEDVKLEGKTLVNIADIKTINSTGRIKYLPLKMNFEIGKTYTIVFNLNKDIDDLMYFAMGSWSGVGAVGISSPRKGIHVVKVVGVLDESVNGFKKQIGVWCSKTNDGVHDYILTDIVVLEGDHTQNPPSYFEGVKSVGDGVDEISVESQNFNEDIRLSGRWLGGTTPNLSLSEPDTNMHYSILCNSKQGYKYRVKPIDRGYYAFLDKDYRVLIGGGVLRSDSEYETIEAPQNTAMAIFYIKSSNITEDITGRIIHIDKLYQSDKKRLLYYNEETQTWEKPILRQWDSIEKHADGKYYYHQRSGEVVLNGSEDISINGSFVETKRFLVKIENSIDRGAVVCDKFSWEHIDADYEHIYQNSSSLSINILTSKLPTQDVQGFKQWLQANNVTVVYQLAQEKVYECTNIDLITYSGETNYIVESGAIVPRTTLKVHNNISNVVSLLQKKVSLLESNITSYMITQNRLMLASRYNADTVSFKVDVASYNNSFEYDNDLYELILNNILVGKDNYNREYIENLIIFYWMDFIISDEMYLTLFEIIEEQHNPKIVEDQEETPLI